MILYMHNSPICLCTSTGAPSKVGQLRVLFLVLILVTFAAVIIMYLVNEDASLKFVLLYLATFFGLVKLILNYS